MSLVYSDMPNQRHNLSPTDLSINLNSNNPFRRSISPNPTSPIRIPPPSSATSADDSRNSMSRNPFLDPPTGAKASSHDPATSKLADDIFKDLSVLDKSVSNGNQPPRNGPLRSGAPPVRPSEGGSRPMKPRPTNGERGPHESPAKSRPRRNSESSVMDKDRADEDKRRRERRRERERRAKEGGSKDGKPRSGKKQHGLDVIDKLDVTGIYGQGLFHHDGPFDACNPHRNRKNNVRAPMSAFPENSANNALAGGGPKTFDYDKFHGRGEEGFADFAASGQEYTTDRQWTKPRQPNYVNPTDRVEQLHGAPSHGLGTSTFLEGAPASRTAIQRRESEREEVPQVPPKDAGLGGLGGLGRKKSLAMRIRGMSQPRRPGEYPDGRIVSPEGYGPQSPQSPPAGPLSAGGPLRARPANAEKNPFFRIDNEDASDKKGAQVQENEIAGRPRADSSPKGAPLIRSVTADSGHQGGESSESRATGGFLNRMRSLKGGKRPVRS